MRNKKENLKRINVSLKITELENEVLLKVIEDINKKAGVDKNKSLIIRELIIKEYVELHKSIFIDLGVNTNNFIEVLEVIKEFGIDNIE